MTNKLRAFALCFAGFVAACGSTTGKPSGTPDMAVAGGADLATSSPDLATAAGPDLAMTTTADLAMATGACTNAADQTALSKVMIETIAQNCATQNFGQEPGTSSCIKMMSGLSDGCVACFTATVQCVFMKCLNQCLSDPNGAACMTCRQTNCDPAFASCSGLNP